MPPFQNTVQKALAVPDCRCGDGAVFYGAESAAVEEEGWSVGSLGFVESAGSVEQVQLIERDAAFLLAHLAQVNSFSFCVGLANLDALDVFDVLNVLDGPP